MGYLSGYEGLNGDVLGQVRSACAKHLPESPASRHTPHQKNMLVLLAQVGRLANTVNDELGCLEGFPHPTPASNGISVKVVLEQIHSQLIDIAATATAWAEKALAASSNGTTEGRRF